MNKKRFNYDESKDFMGCNQYALSYLKLSVVRLDLFSYSSFAHGY